MKKAYVVCSVRNSDEDSKKEVYDFVKKLEDDGWTVFNPHRDADQNCPTGYKIVMAELKAMKECDQVFAIWDVNSKGSHVDLGMAFMAEKPITIVKLKHPDVPEKSYVKVIEEIKNKGYLK